MSQKGEYMPKAYIGKWFFIVGWGYRVYTMRGWVTVDTRKELQEELNNLESASLPR